MPKSSLLRVSALAALLLPAAARAQHSVPGCPDVKDSDFRKVSVVDKTNSGITEPLKFAFDKDGRIYWMERTGGVRRYDPKTRTAANLVNLNIYRASTTRGGMGIALDPDFETNKWIYVVYAPNVNPSGVFRLSRFTVNGDLAQDEKTLLNVNFSPSAGQHASGSLAFDNDGNLFWGLGDETNPHDAGANIAGYAPIASNVPDNDARRSSGNTNNLNGKILRIHPEANGTYTIPAGNLFPPGTPLTKPEIDALAFRNPWTLWFDKATGWLFEGEVGPDAAAFNGQKGPSAMDELNVIKSPGNYGWPFLGGKNVPYNNYDYVANKTGPLFDPNALVNNSPNNTGMKELPPGRPAFLAYAHDGKSPDQVKFPALGGASGGTATTGPVYRYDAALKSSIKLPPHFDNVWFFGDWFRNAYYAATLDAEANSAVDVKKVFTNIGFANVVSSGIGPDGALYFIEYGPTYFSSPSSQRISRIEYTGSCIPTAVADHGGSKAASKPARFRVSLDQGMLLFRGRDVQGRR